MATEILIRQFELICDTTGKRVSARYKAHDVEIVELADGTTRKILGPLQNWTDLSCDECNRYPLCLNDILQPLSVEMLAQAEDDRRALHEEKQINVVLKTQIEEIGKRAKRMDEILWWLKDNNIKLPEEFQVS